MSKANMKRYKLKTYVTPAMLELQQFKVVYDFSTGLANYAVRVSKDDPGNEDKDIFINLVLEDQSGPFREVVYNDNTIEGTEDINLLIPDLIKLELVEVLND